MPKKATKADLKLLINSATFLSKDDKKSWILLVSDMSEDDAQMMHYKFLKASEMEQQANLKYVYKNNLGSKFIQNLTKNINKFKKFAIQKENIHRKKSKNVFNKLNKI